MKKIKLRYSDECELSDMENTIEQSLQTNGYCCFDCGVSYLTEKQKSEHSVATFHYGNCIACLKETSVTHIRHYNWLIKQNK